jgi:hypothetical protein
MADARRSRPSPLTPTLRSAQRPTSTLPFGEASASTQATKPLHQILKQMKRVDRAAPLLELVLMAARTVAPKAAIVAVKREELAGLVCTSAFGDREAFVNVRVDAREPSFLATAVAAGEYVGPLLRTNAHAPFFAFAREKKPEIVAVAIRATRKPVAILFARDVRDVGEALPVLREIAAAAGEAFGAIARAQR